MVRSLPNKLASEIPVLAREKANIGFPGLSRGLIIRLAIRKAEGVRYQKEKHSIVLGYLSIVMYTYGHTYGANDCCFMNGEAKGSDKAILLKLLT